MDSEDCAQRISDIVSYMEKLELEKENQTDREIYLQLQKQTNDINTKLKQYEGEIAFLCDGIKKENNEMN